MNYLPPESNPQPAPVSTHCVCPDCLEVPGREWCLACDGVGSWPDEDLNFKLRFCRACKGTGLVECTTCEGSSFIDPGKVAEQMARFQEVA